ncbi:MULTISPECIES: HU family DNA-binding protein [Parabacteroides]|nr:MULTISPECIES: HU family DNA-binding protein [Parabacteroides]MCA5585385.1 HU family DNA-binding protein [Parabacteroides gordonii]
MEEGAITSQGFGTFTLWPQSERTGRNPQTGSPH